MSGTGDSCHNRGLWGGLGPGARGDDWAPGRGAGALGAHLGVVIPGGAAAVDRSGSESESEFAGRRKSGVRGVTVPLATLGFRLPAVRTQDSKRCIYSGGKRLTK